VGRARGDGWHTAKARLLAIPERASRWRLAVAAGCALLAVGASTARQVVEWRKQCADQLWRAVLALREATPKALYSLDFVTDGEYAGVIASNRIIRTELQELTDDAVARGIFLRGSDTRIESIRPIIGESLWQRLYHISGFWAGSAWLSWEDMG
jgi:hypothetical protein